MCSSDLFHVLPNHFFECEVTLKKYEIVKFLDLAVDEESAKERKGKS